MKKIDYKHQIDRMEEILNSFFADKTLGNPCNDFDEGHQKASKDFSRDMLKIVKMAKEGKL